MLPEPRFGDQRIGIAPHPPGAVFTGHQCRDLDVLPNRERAEEPQILERPDQALAGQPVGRNTGEVLPVDFELSGRRSDDTGQDVDEGRLARTIRSDDADHLAALGLDPCIVQRTESTESHVDAGRTERLPRNVVELLQRCRCSRVRTFGSPSDPGVDLPVIEETDRSPDHEAEHGHTEEHRLEVLPEDPIEGRLVEADAEELETVLTHAPGELTPDGHHDHTDNGAGDAVATANDQHHEGQQGVVEEEVAGKDRSVLPDLQR